MESLSLKLPAGRAPKLLFIGAHCDDIEIGCGGTAIELLDRYPDAEVHWVVLSSNEVRAPEAREAASGVLQKVKKKIVILKDFRESFFPSEAPSIKEFFEQLKRDVSPDMVFAHYREDLHQDHRTVGELIWNTYRNHMILEYEIPKYDGGLGSPGVFVPLSEATVKRKIDLLMRCFGSQVSKQWFTPDTFRGLMRLRGIECNAPGGFAEAYYARKICLI
jgi:LmbE family N-acetylglucosaminyl deacetylase